MKNKNIATVILLLLVISSCLPETQEPPFGVWKSEEPKLIMYFKPEYRNVPVRLPVSFSHLGLYHTNDSILNVFISSDPGRRLRIIYDDYELTSRELSLSALLVGDWRLRGEQIHLTLTAQFREKYGLRVVVFDRLEDYPEIDPEDWITEHIAYLIERQS